MSNDIFDFAAGRADDDHPLTEAARVALGANPTPRMLKMHVDHDGLPTEIPDVSVSQISEE